MNEESQNTGSHFLLQGSILALASVISRLIGLLYRVPMTAIIGDVGNNYYACAYDVYNVMLIISSYSLPLAVSKLVSSRMVTESRREVLKVLKGSLLFALLSGGLVSLLVWFGAEFFCNTLLKTPLSVFALRVLAPVLVIVAFLGVIRGFFQGLGNMVYSAISQIIEQIVNAIVSVWAAWMLYHYGSTVGAVLGNRDEYAAAYGAAGGTMGTNLGALAGLCFMLIVLLLYLRRFREDTDKNPGAEISSFRAIFTTLVLTIIPVLLSTTVYNISGILDQAIFKNTALLQGYSESKIDIWWGVYAGKYKLLINVPLAVANAIAVSSVPALTRSYQIGETEKVHEQINASRRFVMIVALPCAVGLAVLGQPIFTLLFPGTVETAPLAGHMMLCGSIAVIFFAMSTLSNGLLQGIDRLKVPVYHAGIALFLHVVLLMVLMLIFRLHIYAVILSNAAFGLIMAVLNAVSLRRYSGCRFDLKKTFLIPAVCSLIMGLCALGIYLLFYSVIDVGNSLSFVIAFVFAVVIYAVLLLLLKGVSDEEIRSFPQGDKLSVLARKLHLL